MHLQQHENNEHLGMDLTKEGKHFHAVNCKTLLREIKEDTNKWKIISYSWTGKLNTLNTLH